MKTTIELPDELLIAAKKRAAERRTTLRDLFERGLRRELQTRRAGPASDRKRTKPFRLVTSHAGLPPGLDLSNRERMYDWIFRQK